jgi:hypothetical protein
MTTKKDDVTDIESNTVEENTAEKTETVDVPQNYVISLDTLNKVLTTLGQIKYANVFQLMDELRKLQAVKLTTDTDKETN